MVLTAYFSSLTLTIIDSYYDYYSLSDVHCCARSFYAYLAPAFIPRHLPKLSSVVGSPILNHNELEQLFHNGKQQS